MPDGKEAKTERGNSPPPEHPRIERRLSSKQLMIYLGPTIVENNGEFVLKTNTIYSNGLPPDVAERAKTDVNLARFFVPVGKVKQTMNQLSDANSHLSQLSNNIRKISLTGRKKAR